MARPKKQIDMDLVGRLAMIQCTIQEIATFIGVNNKTLVKQAGFLEIYKKGQENGKMSIRRMQFKLAEKNTTMAIWLGKQYLGQTDKIETSFNRPATTEPIELVITNESDNTRANVIEAEVKNEYKGSSCSTL